MTEPSWVGAGPGHLPHVGGIVLAGTYYWHASAFEQLRARPLLPVAGKPLIEHVLDWLDRAGVPEVVICANCSTAPVERYLKSARQRLCAIGYYEDVHPRGAAGCVKDAAASAKADTFVITDGASVPTADLAAVLAHHRNTQAAVTIVVYQRRLEGTNRFYAHPTGTYILQRDVLDAVPSGSFQDIKENLIPKLYAAGRRIEVFVAPEVSPRVFDATSYLALNQWMINRMWAASITPGNPEGQLLLAHPTAVVGDDALIIGPVVLGPEVRIDSRAIIVGPSAVGSGGTIGPRAVLARSVTWEGCSIREQAVVDQCLLADGVDVEAAARLRRTLKVAERNRSHHGRLVPQGTRRHLIGAIARSALAWEFRSLPLWRLFQ
jgi:NDP-sugar pyrophosphorylase family protein